MKYLEDYISKELIDAIDSELKKVYDDEEFVLCGFSMLENDEEARKLLDYLKSNDITEETRYKIIIFLLDLQKNRKLNNPQHLA